MKNKEKNKDYFIKKKWIISIVVMFGLITIFIIEKPHDVINIEENNITVVMAEFNAGYRWNDMEVIDISDKSDEIIAILDKYEERLSFSIAKGYDLGDVEFRITLNYGDGFKEIILGDVNYSYKGRGDFKCTIINAYELIKELRKLVE